MLSLAVVLALAAPAAAQETWTSTSGSFTFTSTPAPTGETCTGYGLANLSLSGDGTTDSGELTPYFQFVSDGCSGDLPAVGSSFTSSITLSQSGNSLSGTDEYGDSITGSFSGDQVQLTLTVGGASSSVTEQSGGCVEYCSTVYVFTFTGGGSLFGVGLDSLSGVAAGIGGAMGAGGAAGALVSGRRPRIPPQSVSASFELGTIGHLSDSPTGQGGANIPTQIWVRDPHTAAPPPWAYDYRTAPYTPNPLIQGWPELCQKFQMSLNGQLPHAPNFPFFTEPAPPTGWPGVFCQPRINPQTGNWSWWDPVSGVFPYG